MRIIVNKSDELCEYVPPKVKEIVEKIKDWPYRTACFRCVGDRIGFDIMNWGSGVYNLDEEIFVSEWHNRRLRAICEGGEEPLTDIERQFMYYWGRRGDLMVRYPVGTWVLCVGDRMGGPGDWKLAVFSDLETLGRYCDMNNYYGNAIVWLGHEFMDTLCVVY